MNRINPYLNLIRFYNPIGFWLLLWPGFWGLFLQPGFNISDFTIILLGSFLTRSLGCAINDFFDSDYDRKVDRTKSRPIPSGQISKRNAAIFIVLLASICLCILSLTNTFTIKFVLLICIPLIILYPLSKRFLSAPQLILGVTFGLSLPISYSIVHGNLNSDAIFLYVASIFWIIGYDSIYAMSDLKDDMKIKLNSLPVMFMENTTFVIFISYSIFFIMLAFFAYKNGMGLLFLGLIFLIYQFYLQYELIKGGRFLEAFKSNSHIGLIIAMILFIENQNEFFN